MTVVELIRMKPLSTGSNDIPLLVKAGIHEYCKHQYVQNHHYQHDLFCVRLPTASKLLFVGVQYVWNESNIPIYYLSRNFLLYLLSLH